MDCICRGAVGMAVKAPRIVPEGLFSRFPAAIHKVDEAVPLPRNVVGNNIKFQDGILFLPDCLVRRMIFSAIS